MTAPHASHPVTVGVLRPGANPTLVPLAGADARGRFGYDALAVLLDGADAECAFRIPLDAATFLSGWCDDSGLLRELPLNFRRWRADGDPIVGPVVLTREERGEDGWLLGLEDGDLARIALVTPLRGGAAAGPRVLVTAAPR